MTDPTASASSSITDFVFANGQSIHDDLEEDRLFISLQPVPVLPDALLSDTGWFQFVHSIYYDTKSQSSPFTNFILQLFGINAKRLFWRAAFLNTKISCISFC